VCPISFVPVETIVHPVGFDTTHEFECECILEWLTRHRCTNPATGAVVGPVKISTILHLLIVGKSQDLSHLTKTINMLQNAGTASDSESLLTPEPIGFPAAPTTSSHLHFYHFGAPAIPLADSRNMQEDQQSRHMFGDTIMSRLRLKVSNHRVEVHCNTSK
jgi:hypothetical protein